MERSGSGMAAAAEELLRLLAGAAAAARLYPPTSPLRLEAIARFASGARSLTESAGAVQYRVDRERFVIDNTAIGEGLPQVSALAETLHSLQVGQLIVAPGVSEREVEELLSIIGSEARAVRASGGARAALLEAGVHTIAFVEVSLRASTEAGLLGLDLTGAPLDDIAAELVRAAATWQQDALAGEAATDVAATAVGRLESAAQDLAMQRCAEALLHLDEATRTDLLANALTVDANGQRMEAMLQIVAHMKPAALARLLRLTAAMSAQRPDGILHTLEIPPELAAELAALMKPSSGRELEAIAASEPDAESISREVAAADEEDGAHISALVHAATPKSAAARGLATVVRIARDRPTEDTVRAITEALGGAVGAGAFEEVADAAELLAEFGESPALAPSVQAARALLGSPEILRECVTRLALDPTAHAAHALLVAAGSAGAEALADAYLAAPAAERARLTPVVAAMADTMAPVAGRILRTGERAEATTIIAMLRDTGTRRLLPTIALALEHLDVGVREAAVLAIAAADGPDRARLLEKTLAHWDPETRRIAAREIGHAGVTEAVPALLKIVAEVNLFERNYELKKEVLKSLEALGSPQAVPVLERLAGRTAVIGKKNRELRYLARRVLESLRDQKADRRGSGT